MTICLGSANFFSVMNLHTKISRKGELGFPFVLEPQDESPFMKFGYVYPGQTVPSLYNNLIRAPLFRHKPYPTDFLVVRYGTIDLMNSVSQLTFHTQKYGQRRDKVFLTRNQTSVCRWSNLSRDRSSRPSLTKNNQYDQIQIANNRIQTFEEESRRTSQNLTVNEVLP